MSVKNTKTPHTTVWWVKVLGAQNVITVLACVFSAGGVWAFYVKNSEQIVDIDQRVSTLEQNQVKRDLQLASFSANQDSIMDQVRSINEKLDKREDVLDTRLDRITDILLSRSKEKD